jgi:hypothetical protein
MSRSPNRGWAGFGERRAGIVPTASKWVVAGGWRRGRGFRAARSLLRAGPLPTHRIDPLPEEETSASGGPNPDASPRPPLPIRLKS